MHRTGLGFDPLGAAESATDLGLSLLFNTDRLNRMAQYQVEYSGLGVSEMVDMLVERTWKAPRLQGLSELIRQQNGQMLLTYLLSASVDEKASFATKAQLRSGIDGLKTLLEGMRTQAKGTSDEGNIALALERMKDPSKAKGTVRTVTTPPGSPIGCEDEE